MPWRCGGCRRWCVLGVGIDSNLELVLRYPVLTPTQPRQLCLAALVHVLASALLLFNPMDPSLVDPSAPHNGPLAPPSPFQRPKPTTNFRAFVPIFGVGAAIACLGAAAALLRSPLGLKLYSLAAFLHLLYAAPLSPTPTLAPALTTVVVPIALAERLYARLVPSCVVVSPSGLARRFQ